MSQRDPHRPSPESRPDASASSTGGERRPRACLAPEKEGGPGATLEIDGLLQARLRAAGIFFTVTLALTLGRDFVLGGAVAWQLQVAAILAVATIVAILSAPRPITTRRLRILEILIFGIAAAILALRHYHAMMTWASRGDEVAIVTAAKNMIISSVLLMFAYAMLIPGTWRRALRFVVTFSILPEATTALLLLVHPSLLPAIRDVATFDRVSRDFVLLLIAGGLSVYGTHVLNALRREVFEARRLNQYRLGKKIGAGGMGEVYLAEHQLLKRPCAVKLIRPDKAGDARELARFEREVRATARLSHPNTVDVYDFGCAEDGTFYYVMEYLHGLPLDELVDRHGPLPAGRVIYLLRQACEALAEAHGAGLIHRDLKPANIFAARRGGRSDFVKLLDFGLVKETNPEGESLELSQKGIARGSPQYMAPEQVVGSPLDQRCDLYALGGVAYTLITGRPPFDGESPASVMIAVTRDVVVPPSRLRPDVPADLEHLILTCLAKDPGSRPSSAEEVGQALAHCQSAAEWDASAAASWWKEREDNASRKASR